MLALGRLLRVSLAPSALADIGAGVVLGAGHWPAGSAAFLLMAGSACVYHGGMALNDWADREEDARNARERPIPRGEISPGSALALAASLLAVGPALAWLAAPQAGACLMLVTLLAVLYDLRARGPWAGPVLLGTCRAGNLTSGLLLGSLASVDSSDGILLGTPRWIALAPILYGSYVFSISRLARLEDRRPEEIAEAHPRHWVLLAAGLLWLHAFPSWFGVDAGSAPPGWLARAAALALLSWSGLGLLRAWPAGDPWTPNGVGQVVGMGLRRLLVATGALSASLGSPEAILVGALILCGYPLSYALRRLFPPT